MFSPSSKLHGFLFSCFHASSRHCLLKTGVSLHHLRSTPFTSPQHWLTERRYFLQRRHLPLSLSSGAMFLHKSLLLLLTFLCPFLSTIFSLPCADHRCRSGICAEDGTCICIPPSITLDGHRPFFGGTFCDELQIMCGVRSMFWCEHGGSCEEAVLGEEEYFCACPWGYAGRHCELVGAPCGEMFCFHGAECPVNEQTCQCPPGWRGSLDCVLPTSTNDSVVQSTPTILPPDKGHHIEKWFVAVVAVASSLLIVTAAVLLAKKCCRKSESALTKFQDLYQVQMQGVLDDEEDPSPVPELNDGAHL